MKTIINFKTDPKVKKAAQKAAKKIGLPLSVVMNRYLNEFVKNPEVSFGTNETWENLRPEAKRRLTRLHKDVVKGKNTVGPFESADEMDDYLDSLND